MTLRAMMQAVLCVAALALAEATTASAALPSATAASRKVEKMLQMKAKRERAPEVVELRVQSAQRAETARDTCKVVHEWTISAAVASVQASATSLTPGATITLRYTVSSMPAHSPCGGAQQYHLQELAAGDTVSAYLQSADGEYKVAAGAWSFTSEADFQRELDEARRARQQ